MLLALWKRRSAETVYDALRLEGSDHGRATIPSRRRTSGHAPLKPCLGKGNFAAGFSSRAIPSPGKLLGQSALSCTSGQPGNTSRDLSRKRTNSWMPKFAQDRSSARLASWVTGDASPGPCQAVRTPKNSHKAASVRAGVRPRMSEMCTRMKSTERLDDREELRDVGVELTHRDRHARLFADETEIGVVLGGDDVLEEEQPVSFEMLGELDRHRWRQAFVDVVR